MTDPYTEARNASAGMPRHSMSADVGVREAGGDKLRETLRDGTQIMTASERVQWIERAKAVLR